MQMYAHPKRHRPQTETTDKEQHRQTCKKTRTHLMNPYPSHFGDGWRWTRGNLER